MCKFATFYSFICLSIFFFFQFISCNFLFLFCVCTCNKIIKIKIKKIYIYMLLNLSLEGEILKYNDVLYIATYAAWILYSRPQHSMGKSKVYKKEQGWGRGGGGVEYIIPLMLSTLTMSLNLCCFSASKDRKRFKTWRIWTDLSEGSLSGKQYKQNWNSESAT